MSTRSRLAGFELIHLLLLVTAIELALNRLAVPMLRPTGDTPPPGWHEALDHVALFVHYFASLLAVGALGHALLRVVRGQVSALGVGRWLVFAAGASFAVTAIAAIALNPGARMSLGFELLFTVVVIAVVIAQLPRGGDTAAKVGIAVLAAPLLIHCYGALALHVFGNDSDLSWLELPGRVHGYGQWGVVLAALSSPLWFAPRPLLSSAKAGPLALAAMTAMMTTALFRLDYERCYDLARNALGIDIGPMAPSLHLALYTVALAALAWTLAACFLAEAPARRELGVGLALVIAGGYAFSWPLQYLVSVVGLMAMGESATAVAAQERGARSGGFRPPPIAEDVWQGYVGALLEALRADSAATPGAAPVSSVSTVPPGSMMSPASTAATMSPASTAPTVSTVSTVTVKGEGDSATTYVVARRRGAAVTLRVDRVDHAIVAVDLLVGDEPPDHEPPAWTLQARPERMLVGIHPEPPATSAPTVRSSDPAFGKRFRIRDGGGFTDAMFDDVQRARAVGLIDGWMALWPERGLRYRVHPGYGAPLDHPIPITKLAMRSAAPVSVERLLSVIGLVVELAESGLKHRA